jgi:hypothetical protein
MKKFFLLFFVVLAVFAGKKSQAQVTHTWTSPDTLLVHQLIQNSPGNYEMISSLRSLPPTGVNIRSIAVSFYAHPFDVNANDEYFTYYNDSGSNYSTINGYINDFDWNNYSQIVFEWYVEYSNDTYEDYWIEYNY